MHDRRAHKQEAIAPGSVVRLKSGGPAMSVTSVAERMAGMEAAECLWFSGSEVKAGVFPLCCLEAAGGAEEEGPGGGEH